MDERCGCRSERQSTNQIAARTSPGTRDTRRRRPNESSTRVRMTCLCDATVAGSKGVERRRAAPAAVGISIGMMTSRSRQLLAAVSPSPGLSRGALGGIRTPNLLIRSAPRGRCTGSRKVPNCLKDAGQLGYNFRTAKLAGTRCYALGPNCWLFCWLNSFLPGSRIRRF